MSSERGWRKRAFQRRLGGVWRRIFGFDSPTTQTLSLELLRGGFPCVIVEKEHRLDYYEALNAACGASGELEKFDFFVVELVVKRLCELLAV